MWCCYVNVCPSYVQHIWEYVGQKSKNIHDPGNIGNPSFHHSPGVLIKSK